MKHASQFFSRRRRLFRDRQTRRQRSWRGKDGRTGPAQGGTEFSDIVESVLSNVTKSGDAMQAQAANLANGNADVLDLVTAVAETELAVETLVTVRDRMISAYQEILNMPI